MAAPCSVSCEPSRLRPRGTPPRVQPRTLSRVLPARRHGAPPSGSCSASPRRHPGLRPPAGAAEATGAATPPGHAVGADARRRREGGRGPASAHRGPVAAQTRGGARPAGGGPWRTPAEVGRRSAGRGPGFGRGVPAVDPRPAGPGRGTRPSTDGDGPGAGRCRGGRGPAVHRLPAVLHRLPGGACPRRPPPGRITARRRFPAHRGRRPHRLCVHAGAPAHERPGPGRGTAPAGGRIARSPAWACPATHCCTKGHPPAAPSGYGRHCGPTWSCTTRWAPRPRKKPPTWRSMLSSRPCRGYIDEAEAVARTKAAQAHANGVTERRAPELLEAWDFGGTAPAADGANASPQGRGRNVITISGETAPRHPRAPA